MRSLFVAVVVAVGLLMGPAGAAAQTGGATTLDCSTISPELGGTLVITPQGDLLANCWQHSVGTDTPAAGGSATRVDCSEVLGQPGAMGIQVITPTGGVFTNCLVHFR